MAKVKYRRIQPPGQTEGVVKPHSFSRVLAKEWGVSKAIVLGYLAHKVRRSNNIRDGLPWFYNPVSDIAGRFPYFAQSTVHGVLKRLEADGLIKIGNYNKWSIDRTRWYYVPEEVCDEATRRLIYFDPLVAATTGVSAAVLLRNLQYHIGKLAEAYPGTGSHMMSPAILHKLLPFSASTIKRALKVLELGGYIEKCSISSPIYRLGIAGIPKKAWEPDLDELVQF